MAKTNTKPTVHSPAFGWDMSSWLEEKTSSALLSLARAIPDIQSVLDASSLGELEKDIILDRLYNALSQSINALWFASGGDVIGNETMLVFEGGEAGCLELFDRWAVPHVPTAKVPDTTSLADIREELLHLVQGERAPSRTFIHSLLRCVNVSHPTLRQIAELTERVTIGQMEWAEYQVAVTQLFHNAAD